MDKMACFLALTMLASAFSGCSEEGAVDSGVTAYAAFEAEYSSRDCDVSYENEKIIDLASGEVVIDKEGVYVLTGSLEGGSVVIDAPETDKVQLVLRDASITSAASAAINAKQCDKLFITLEGNNSIADSATYTLADGEETDAAIFARNDVTINGSGTLNVTGNYKHGIATKDDFKLTGGTVNITSVEDGIKGRDSVLIKDGVLNITAGTDGIQSNNDSGEDKGRISIDGGNVTIVCGNDGIQAESVLQVNGGVLDIKAGDEAGTEIKVETQGGFGGGMRGMRPGGGEMSQGTPPAMPEGGMPGRGNRGGGRGMRPDGGEMPPEMPGGGRGMRPDRGEMPQNTPLQESEENTESIKGLKSANALYINDGEITVSAQDDAIHSDIALTVNGGNMSLRSADDAIHAEYNATINDGNITIARCYEGIEGKAVVINGGTIAVNAEDDGINASDPEVTNAMPGRGDDSVYVEINGGTVKVVSKVDGIDSNGNLTINGGDVVVDGPSMGMESAIDCDGRAYVNGGEVAASGVAVSNTFAEESEQGSLTVIFTSSQTAGTAVVLKDEKGNEIKSIVPEKDFSGVVFSSAKLKKGGKYTVSYGDASFEVELNELRAVVSDTGEAIAADMGRMPQGGGRGGRKMQ